MQYARTLCLDPAILGKWLSLGRVLSHLGHLLFALQEVHQAFAALLPLGKSNRSSDFSPLHFVQKRKPLASASE